jgi:hypothetical protein
MRGGACDIRLTASDICASRKSEYDYWMSF